MKTKKFIGNLVICICIALAFYYVFDFTSKKIEGKEDEKILATEALIQWNTLLLKLERQTIGYRAPVSARMYCYMGLAAYESSIPFLKDFTSFAIFDSSYSKITPPVNCYLPQSLNTSMAKMCKYFFRTAPEQYFKEILILEKKFDELFKQKKDGEVLTNSAQFGKSIAEAIWQYSITDSVGHDGFLKNYDPNFKLDTSTYAWKVNPDNKLPPLLPHWGASRTFVVQTKDYSIDMGYKFDSLVGSTFYTVGMEVLSANRSFTKEQIWVAEFWSDDFPQLTMSSAGRWISITNQIIDKEKPSFEKTIEVYLKMGLALNDAAVVSWDQKYKNNLMRPETYIRKYLDASWQPLHDAPNFPSFPSGHSVFGAASAEVLESFFGPHYEFTDNTHKGRQEFIGNPRKFNSFYEMSQENAYSRILIGVHYRTDCTEGLKLGSIIGKKIVALNMKKKEN